MSLIHYIGNYFHEVSKGRTDSRAVILQGHNQDIDTSATEDVWPQGGTLSYLSSAERMNLVSGSASDDSDGTGARTVLVSGLNGSYAEISETVTMNGTSNVLTELSYLRVHSIIVLTAGSAGSNVGIITATAATSSSVQCAMHATSGRSESIHFTIPRRYNGYVIGYVISSTKTGSGSPIVNIVGWYRPYGGAWVAGLDLNLDTSVNDTLTIENWLQTKYEEKTDIRMTASTNANNTVVFIRAYLILEPK